MFLFGFFKIILITIITFMIISFTGIFTNWRFSKDDAISKYTSALQTIGDFSLTSNAKLQGKREFGKDHYTGKYSVNYKYFTGEYLYRQFTTTSNFYGSGLITTPSGSGCKTSIRSFSLSCRTALINVVVFSESIMVITVGPAPLR